MDVALILGMRQNLPQGSNEWRKVKRVCLDDFTDTECISKFRLPKSSIRDIIEQLRPDLQSSTHRNNPVPAETQVLVSLRLLASGSFQGVAGDTVKVSQPTTSRIIYKFCQAFTAHFKHLLAWYTDETELREVRLKFYKDTKIKGLIGLIDGTMIPIKGAVGEDEPAYICRKNFPAINCQVVVGPDGEFRDAVIKYPGSCHDAFIFNNSTLKGILEQDPGQGFLLGDSGYALSPTLLTPFANPSTPPEVKYNKIHSSVRSAVERSIGKLKNRWRCLHKSGGALQYEPSKCCLVIHTCILLENLCISLGLEDPEIDDEEDDESRDPVLDGQHPNQTRIGAQKRTEVMNSLFQDG